MDHAIRELLATEVLTPARMEAAIEKAISALQRTNAGPGKTALQRRLREVERTLANLTETAAKGGAVPAVLEALNRVDQERRALVAELHSEIKGSNATFELSAADLRRKLRGYMDDWHAMLQGNVTEARGLLTVVLRERITLTPTTGLDGNPAYELKVPIAFDQLLVRIVPGLVSRVGMVDAGGIEPPTS